MSSVVFKIFLTFVLKISAAFVDDNCFDFHFFVFDWSSVHNFQSNALNLQWGGGGGGESCELSDCTPSLILLFVVFCIQHKNGTPMKCPSFNDLSFIAQLLIYSYIFSVMIYYS